MTATPGDVASALSLLRRERTYSEGWYEPVAKLLESLSAERETFYMNYRMTCDQQTKALHVENAALAARCEKAEAAYKLAERRTLLSIASWLTGLSKSAKHKANRVYAGHLAYEVECNLVPTWAQHTAAVPARDQDEGAAT